ncbi:MAG: hypothetical protein A3I75_01105 [Deltaproteobacteria bacterium RIFCSPLOWO2_02_FULL_50_16]|nr:MAG: hypothetical protein A3I75_01105 [Deltaproteobacteria bacterium RIFCSPLOWO2_02_FULL_50_16]OGQ66959.1 MAG: hypothetical protein A3F89_08275 [Deltaproteobacteria bacterium RIFCSPLOWO2_12_FULL_50_11]
MLKSKEQIVNSTGLNPHELDCLSHISTYSGSLSQRDLSRKTGLSLGLINAILKKLINTGYIKVSHLNKKKLKYILTPKGLSELALKSYHYILKTVNNYNLIQSRMKETLQQLVNKGHSVLFYNGNGELLDLLNDIIQSEFSTTLLQLKDFSDRTSILARDDAVVINLTSEPINSEKIQVINLYSEINSLNQ